MASYLLWSKHAIQLPVEIRPSAKEAVDWLERTLLAEGARVERLGDTALAFRGKLGLRDWIKSKRTFAFISDGEVDVTPAWDGFRITVRANPRFWLSFIPVALSILAYELTDLSVGLRW